jgi:hypothetical protein
VYNHPNAHRFKLCSYAQFRREIKVILGLKSLLAASSKMKIFWHNILHVSGTNPKTRRKIFRHRSNLAFTQLPCGLHNQAQPTDF